MTRTYDMDRHDLLTVVGLYACSTALYALLGVRFDATTVTSMQFIDAPLLKERLAESLWYFHATPPVLNLIVGIGLKGFGAYAATFYSVLFHVMGFLVALSVYTLTTRLSSSRVAAAVTTGLLVFSTSFVLYENSLFYDFLSMALLTFVTLALYQFVRTRSRGWCVGFFVLLAVLLLTRSVFHLVWMLAITALLVALLWPWRRQILIAAIVPLLVVTLWYAKNYYYFGKFGASTWMGLGLYNITVQLVPQKQLVPLVERHELSPWALVSRYDTRGLIFLADLRPRFGAPVVDKLMKAGGRANWNFRDIPAIDAYYTADALTVIRRFPATYVYGILLANRMYFAPTSMSPFWMPANWQAVQPMEQVFTPLLSGISAHAGVMSMRRYGFPDKITGPVHTNIVLIVAWLGVFAWAYGVARRVLIDPAARSDPRVLVLGFLVFTAVYNYVISTTLELGENYRYRYLLEPLFFVLAATAITSAIREVRLRLQRSRAPAAGQPAAD